MELLPFHVRRTMPHSVNPCISSVIVCLWFWIFEWFLIVTDVIFLSMNYENVGECSQTNVATFECGIICGNRRYWEGKSQQLALMPAGQSRANASRSTLVGSRTGSALSFDNQLGHQGNQTALIIQKPTEASLFVVASRLVHVVFSSHDDAIGGLPMCVLSYIFAWHWGSSGQRPPVVCTGD